MSNKGAIDPLLPSSLALSVHFITFSPLESNHQRIQKSTRSRNRIQSKTQKQLKMPPTLSTSTSQSTASSSEPGHSFLYTLRHPQPHTVLFLLSFPILIAIVLLIIYEVLMSVDSDIPDMRVREGNYTTIPDDIFRSGTCSGMNCGGVESGSVGRAMGPAMRLRVWIGVVGMFMI